MTTLIGFVERLLWAIRWQNRRAGMNVKKRERTRSEWSKIDR